MIVVAMEKDVFALICCGSFHVSGILEMSKCKLALKMGDDPLRHNACLLVSPRKTPPINVFGANI